MRDGIRMAGIKRMLLDKDIREPLFEFLEDTFGKVRILEEKTMGRSRADVVMVLPGAVWGIEIKSDADSYQRLETQVRDYDRYYDCNVAVVGASHAHHIHEHIPSYWGIITVDEEEGIPDFYVLRQPELNPKVSWKKKLEILWRPELAMLQEWNGMPKYKDKSKSFVIEKILERIPERLSEDALSGQISDLLFERDYNQVARLLEEYRKGELEKQIEREQDPEKRRELLEEQAKKRLAAPKRKKRRRRRSLL